MCSSDPLGTAKHPPRNRIPRVRPRMAPKRKAPEEQKIATVLKKLHVTQQSFKLLSEALHHPLSDLPEDCRQMLLAGLPFSVCVFQDERHEVQEVVVGMLEQAMSKILGGLQVALDQENEKVAGAEATKEDLERKLQAAEEALKGAKSFTAEKSEALEQATQAVVKAKAALTQRTKEQQQGETELGKVVAEKDLLEVSKKESFEALKLGSLSGDKEVKAAFKKLEPSLKLLVMDQSLRNAIPGVLTRPPSERGVFDGTVLDELEKNFESKISELSTAIQAAQPGAAQRQEVVDGAQQDLSQADEAQAQATKDMCAAKEAQKEATQGVSQAKEAVAAYKTEYKSATKTRDEKQAELQAFVDGSLATFQELKVRCKKRKAVEETEATEEKATETASQREVAA